MKFTQKTNSKKGTVEITFPTDLSAENEGFLTQIGVHKIGGSKRHWQVKQHPIYLAFFQAIKNSGNPDISFSDIPLIPSHPPKESSIDKYLYSIVVATTSKSSQPQEFIVFESFKQPAEVITRRYLHKHFGESASIKRIYPRKFKKKARIIFKAGRIIQPTSDVRVETIKKPSRATSKTPKATPAKPDSNTYLDRLIAYMHEFYAKGVRATKTQIETLGKKLAVPTGGMLWEGAELSWLLWYKSIYNEPAPFSYRLKKMIGFWDKVQPTYAYADSSKILFQQYSTPCPIAAIVGEYTNMSQANSVFDPSAGNGLLVMGASKDKVHANEIDKTRIKSLEFQGFATITQKNAAEPFGSGLSRKFDVVVTNPPFTSWEDQKLKKQLIIRQYFGSLRGLANHLRLEHLMAGLALDTMKDSGKAAIIIMGHLFFDSNGLIAKYRPFFNWLYHFYRVDDVINLNSFKLYNKQGAVARTMLILIAGRKTTPCGVAPTFKEKPHLATIVNSFEQLYYRSLQYMDSPLTTTGEKLKIALL